MVEDALAWMGLGFLAVLAGFLLVIALIFFAGLYIFKSLAFSTIARKLKYDKPWLAWIPFADICLVLILGGYNWALIFLLFLPIVGWLGLAILLFAAMWKIYERRKYPGYLALLPLLGFVPVVGSFVGLASLVVLGFVAWKDNK